MAKGSSLKVADNDLLRPTAVVLKRKLFDTYQDLENFIFLDLCAGAGTMGLEAWSRGVSRVFLVEKDFSIFKTLQANVQLMNVKYPVAVKERPIWAVKSEVVRWLAQYRDEVYLKLSVIDQQNHIIFFDPPYKMTELYKKVIEEQMLDGNWFLGRLWIEAESSNQREVASKIGRLQEKEEKVITCGDRYIFLANFSS
ncbi:MAG: hypothetical protein A2504_03185 [Bdellovibrionales bacterium RIFOXYD12_FULL_39_22]|nr:MAG: hypothetical protein A2385_15595 [Bdellovibrionales bacterium RIFOXYB1_FULL_39_21]OFZ41532.1 MAG: hypothetical protein A2485_02285 [Bdellovibrionales bacterium RIFOXYC12_FULL_39_17]OFZ45845.1 MAG: hypothetical protein A2404_12650 [Bdellovibrionales bacterium RIFOXYC1_FULL_39_130]OFZ74776.1 MAG: hypothetical protein A2560_10080 [Bdellovibrionales bacterium RIFOXYD1_FULL_39_84]OFZ92637.1 MAG: hypothetical protein A2504_03185 [Bdellovibrionales bacterium RIFOXYD12_FULL_39_22]